MYLGIDIGATRIRLASMASLDDQKIQNKTSFLNSHNFESDFLQIVQKAREFAKDFQGIGIGILGVLDERKVTTFNTNNLLEWEGKPIRSSFEEEFSCPVFMENDAVAAAWGEYFYGGEKSDFAYITWGTGIGGALVVVKENQPEVEQINWEKYLKDWEHRCGGRNLLKKFGKSPADLSEEEWKQVMISFSEELAVFTQKLNPNKIFFGGGITIKQSSRLGKLEFPQIRISQLGEDTGLYGAFSLLRALLGKG